MKTKEIALQEIEAVMREFGVSKTRVGREINKDPNFVDRLSDPRRDITTETLDKVFRYVLGLRQQREFTFTFSL